MQEAADAIGMTQSAASQALAKLEQSLGQHLFDRYGRRLILNEYGNLFLPRVRALLAKAQELGQTFNSDALLLRVAASTTIGNYLLPDCLTAFQKRFPQANISLTVGNTEMVARTVADFEVDVGFIEGMCPRADLTVESWYEDRLVVFANADAYHKKNFFSLEQLANMRWLLREAGSGTREVVVRTLFPYLGQFNVSMELGSTEAIKRAVAAGAGISCLSIYAIEAELKRNQLVILKTGLPVLKRPLYRITHPGRGFTHGIRAFSDSIEAVMKNLR